MPTVADYVEIPQSQLRRVAENVLRWFEAGNPKRRNADFIDRYNTLKERMFSGEGVPFMNRWRVLQFKNLARGRPSRNVRVPYCREIRIIAAVIGSTVGNLLGVEDPNGRTPLNVMEHRANAASLLALMSRHQPRTKELAAWAEFLPCSLETPAFMHAHHQALFGNSGDVMTWDGIGNTRRSELLAAGKQRTWAMTQINFLSDLRRIASGGREYAAVSPALRKECFMHLAVLITNPELKIRLVIIDDTDNEDVTTIKRDLSDFDSVITWDTHLMIAHDRLGINYYSEKPRHTYGWRGMIRELIGLAKYRKREDVCTLLHSLAASVPGADTKKKSPAEDVKRVS